MREEEAVIGRKYRVKMNDVYRFAGDIGVAVASGGNYERVLLEFTTPNKLGTGWSDGRHTYSPMWDNVELIAVLDKNKLGNFPRKKQEEVEL